ncbi:MAG: MgtC/SapB family protein [Alphaproteobacteria bacterium]|nr:MgtC/SapB family protein [Alphaproteobacteria bacterium]
MANLAPPADLLLDLAVALGIGLLIGLERGWESRADQEGGRVAGWRTFGIIGLLGGVLAVAAESQGVIVAAVGLGCVALFLALGYQRSAADREGRGITTEMSALVTFGLGVLAGRGELALSASTAIVMAVLLGIKPEMHGLLLRLERRELLATLRLLLISVVALSVLPDEGFGPWGAINPYRIWRLVVMIAAIGYVGYFAMRIIGPSGGLVATGLLGGLVSSTATTLDFARQGAGQPAQRRILAAAIGMSSAVMMARMCLLAAIVAPSLSVPLGAALLPAAMTCAAVAALLLVRSGAGAAPGGSGGRDPLDIRGAVVMGAVFAVAAFLVQAVQHLAGTAGLYPLAFLSGFFDVDAITLSLAGGVAGGGVEAPVAVAAILIAGLVNTVMKPGLVLSIAGAAMAAMTALPLVAALAVGATGWLLVR